MAFYVTGELTLEKYKFFPYIAWALVIGFSFFVISLVIQVRETAQNLSYSPSNHSVNVESAAARSVNEREQTP